MPKPFQTTFSYLTVLAPLTAALQALHGPEWSWTSGGCFAFAETYAEFFGAELWGVCRHDEAAGDFPVDHALVRVQMAQGQEAVYIDATGIVDVTKLEIGQQLLTKDDEGVFWFEDDFLDDDHLRQLRDILSQAGPWPGSVTPAPKSRRRAPARR